VQTKKGRKVAVRGMMPLHLDAAESEAGRVEEKHGRLKVKG